MNAASIKLDDAEVMLMAHLGLPPDIEAIMSLDEDAQDDIVELLERQMLGVGREDNDELNEYGLLCRRAFCDIRFALYG